MTSSRNLPGLEDVVRREALKRYLEGDEEGALDLLAAARAMAGDATQALPAR
jgi:hypothetical protein